MILQRFVIAAFLAAFLSLLARPVGSQDKASRSVQMVVTAEPKHGDELPMIAQQDVIVNQGHDRRTVTGWIPLTGNRSALELAILIDDSSGISFGSQIEDIKAFINEQPPT